MTDKQFKVGDRVRVVKDAAWNGTCGTVKRVDENYTYFAVDEGSRYNHTGALIPLCYTAPNGEAGFNPEALELIEPDLPADWAIQRTIDELNLKLTVEWVRKYGTYVLKFARYIEKHEQPPVAPELLAAREYVANLHHFNEVGQKSVREGKWDKELPVKAFLAGAEYAWNNPKK